ncbi:hypothetical protein CEXT_737311 [Caerostris extrusa]|uniref:Uncharacterized protein n=1 Tax=Caerostris extrusa TaxID=172846 RepID=A0AAV4WTH5_CAEEX|nr:hypothetical protein CEXT_737311 [Caerostris extrusa]
MSKFYWQKETGKTSITKIEYGFSCNIAYQASSNPHTEQSFSIKLMTFSFQRRWSGAIPARGACIENAKHVRIQQGRLRKKSKSWMECIMLSKN